MKVIQYFINIIFTKNCIPNSVAHFCLKIMYITLDKILYNSSFTWLYLHAYIFQLFYLSIMVRQTIYERV